MRPHRASTWVATGAVAIVVFAGFFKGHPLLAGLPVDLTVAGAALVAFGIVARFLVAPLTFRVPVAWPLVAAFLLLAATAQVAPGPYGSQKLAGLVVTIAAIVGAYYLLGGPDRRRAWVWLHVGVGLLLVALLQAREPTQVARLALDGSNTIAAGRASGVTVVVLMALALAGKRPRLLLALGGAAFAAALVATGSRGPVFASGLAVVAVALLARAGSRTLRVLLTGALGWFGWLLITTAGTGATRIEQSLTGEIDAASTRLALWEAALDGIERHPLGVGLGGFGEATGIDWGATDRVYPHNVLLEVTAELGWLAGFALIALLVVAFRRLIAGATTPYGAALLGIAVFAVANAMVSGDINDNRMMWAALAVAWALPPDTTKTPPARRPGGSGRVRWGAVGCQVTRPG